MKGSTRSRAAARIVASLCAAFFVSQFYRSSTAVIAPELIRDMDLSAEALGGLTGVFFLTFAVAQIPVAQIPGAQIPGATVPERANRQSMAVREPNRPILRWPVLRWPSP